MKNILYAITNIDQKYSSFLREKLKCSSCDKLFSILTHIGSALMTLSICLMMVIFGNQDVRSIGIISLLSLTISHVIVQSLKYAIRRQRPTDDISRENYTILFDRYSFPSGHATAAFSIATTVSLSLPLFSIIAFPLALMIGLSRIYIGVHYLTDVLAGFTIATVTSLLVIFA